jgi:hypothetical protein
MKIYVNYIKFQFQIDELKMAPTDMNYKFGLIRYSF